MDRRQGWIHVTLGLASGTLAVAGQRLPMLEGLPWWVPLVSSACLYAVAFLSMQRSGVSETLRREGWLDHEEAEDRIRDSSVFRQRLVAASYRELRRTEDYAPGPRNIANDRILARREGEVVDQIRRAYQSELSPAGSLRIRGRDLYDEGTLEAWLAEQSQPEAEPTRFAALASSFDEPAPFG